MVSSDYEMAVQEIHDLCKNASTSKSSASGYLEMLGESFAGSFSVQKRKSYFDHRDDSVEIPCGFLKEFPVRDSG